MKIDIEDFKKVEKPTTKIKAVTNIVLNDSLVVENVMVLEGDNALFVTMPSVKKADGTSIDVAHPTTVNLAADITTSVLDVFDTGSYNRGPAEEMHVTDVRIKLIDSRDTKVKAIVNLLLNNEFAINGIKIIDEKVGNDKVHKIFMPTYKFNDEWRNIVYAINQKFAEEMIDKILAEYKKLAK